MFYWDNVTRYRVWQIGLPPNPILGVKDFWTTGKGIFVSISFPFDDEIPKRKQKFGRAIFPILWLSALLTQKRLWEFNPHLAIPTHKCLSCLLAPFFEAVMDPREFLRTLTRRLYRKCRFIQIDFSETWQQAKGKYVVYRKDVKRVRLYVHIHVNENKIQQNNKKKKQAWRFDPSRTAFDKGPATIETSSPHSFIFTFWPF